MIKHLIVLGLIALFGCFSSKTVAQPFDGRKGDVNHDGNIDVLDIVTIANYILEVEPLDEAGMRRADLNGPVGEFDGDGSVDVLDMVKTANIILGNDACPGEPMADIDGNVYQTVMIGTQVWMAENLKVIHYRNGDPIPNVTDHNEWASLETGAYCSYINDFKYLAIYGRLYNWYAVGDTRNIAPTGWHVPTDAEWQTLIDYLGGKQVAGKKLKKASLWDIYNFGTNSSGFTAVPGGYRIFGSFKYFGLTACFWSATESARLTAWSRFLNYNSSVAARYHYYHKDCGFSVRCLRD